MKKYREDMIQSQKPVGLAGISVLIKKEKQIPLCNCHKSLSAWQAFLSKPNSNGGKDNEKVRHKSLSAWQAFLSGALFFDN